MASLEPVWHPWLFRTPLRGIPTFPSPLHGLCPLISSVLVVETQATHVIFPMDKVQGVGCRPALRMVFVTAHLNDVLHFESVARIRGLQRTDESEREGQLRGGEASVEVGSTAGGGQVRTGTNLPLPTSRIVAKTTSFPIIPPASRIGSTTALMRFDRKETDSSVGSGMYL